MPKPSESNSSNESCIGSSHLQVKWKTKTYSEYRSAFELGSQVDPM